VASLEEDVDEDDEEAAQEKMELWQQIQTELAVAQALREKIIPNAVNWFTGEAEDEDDEEEDDDDDDDHDEDHEEDEDEEEGE
jgi:nucleosome assembly protein 1-like 1